MEKKIILPTKYKYRWTDDYKHLFAKIQQNLNYQVIYSDNITWEADTKILVLFATPQHNLPATFDVPKRIKTIGYLRDIHHYHKQNAISAINQMMERYDLVISSAYQLFFELYGRKFEDKMVWLPDFFGPYHRYDLPIKENPMMKCLLSGSVSPIYPLRSYVLFCAQNFKNVNIDFLGSPTTGHNIIHGKYAQMLNNYFCCFTDASIFNYTLAKYFEIPAAGSLLIANKTMDITELGFTKDHYIPVDYHTAIPMINLVSRGGLPEANNIRFNGMDFVRRNHSIRNRYVQLSQILQLVERGKINEAIQCRP